MDIVLGPNRYGKAQTHVVRVVRGAGGRHDLVDLTVSVALSGDLDASHLTGDNTNVLPTDTQKNTVFAFAREHGISSPEAFGLVLARHFVQSRPAITAARVGLDQALWRRVEVGGRPAPHSFSRDGSFTRTAEVTFEGGRARVVSGLRDLVLLNTTDSQFSGFDRDRYTTLPETTDRVLATAVTATWRHADQDADQNAGPDGGPDWNASFEDVVEHLVAAFVETSPSLALQQTLYAMGRRVLEHRPELAEVSLSLPNQHHVLVDLSPFGLENPNEVFHATDRPYGLIEGTVRREGSP